ncbi:hypothetical protein EMPS_09396 [Entomortierella parvispora]|uniref:F-box domain-containing protein n=1 Tax=Entomortierella parvispora TaxID=205924 RepID=A0A9P3HI38_9FUNG|nr:hypothetical protein EMPS_09396 [Entomortierella parvispora]
MVVSYPAPSPSPSPPPSHLAPLPQECLESIIACLRYDLPSLHALLLVSRQFFQLTVPVLYKSPFRLAVAFRDPPIWASRSFATLYRSEASMDHSLGRIKRLTRLLIQNLQIPPPGQQRPPPPSPSILDDSSGMENLQPLIPPFVDQPSTWLRNPNHRPEDVENMWPPFNPDSVLSNVEQDNGVSASAEIHMEPGADLISFDSDWEDDERKGQTMAGSISNRNQQPANSSSSGGRGRGNNGSPRHASGLLMDYFYFYSDHDHRRIRAVIRQIYPGAGRRAYDKYLADIELAILQHSPSKVETLHIHDVIPVVPHLLAHLDSFSKISSVVLHDAVWTHEELILVHQFLVRYAAMFPAAASRALEYPSLEDPQHWTFLRRSAFRNPAIRSLKYASSRAHGDGARINGQEFDPIQLLQALGPGVETVDIVHWATTTLAQLDTLDAGALISLRITPLMTLYEDAAFSRHEFLSRCRRLRHLDLFSSSRDMFGWAVAEWDREHPQGSSTLEPLPSTKQIRHSLVQMRHLRVRGPRDSVVYDIIRDALYGFRDSLQVLQVHSDLAHVGEPEWMDRIGTFTTGKMFAQQREELRRQWQQPEGTRPLAPNDHESYKAMSSIDAGPLLIQWRVSCLSTLELSGPIASELDLESLMFMPNLSVLGLSIVQAPANPRTGNRAGKAPSNLTYLPYVTGPRLQRVLLRGPWRELTDETLWDMVCPDVDFQSSRPLEESVDNMDDDDDDDVDDRLDAEGNEAETERGHCGEWAEQLLELSVLDNPRVTVPVMIQLAKRMKRLEVMGTDLNMRSFSVQQWQSRTSNVRTNPMSNHYGQDPESQARRLLLKMSAKFPSLDIGPDANHLGRSSRRDKP